MIGNGAGTTHGRISTMTELNWKFGYLVSMSDDGEETFYSDIPNGYYYSIRKILYLEVA